MTYSLLALDEHHLGVATASHWVGVGGIVPWAQAGVGVVATQAFTAPSYGPDLLRAMRSGEDPKEALIGLLGRDALAHRRQVAALAADGRRAWHCGSGCLAAVGSRSRGDAVALGNMLMDDGVPDAMLDAFGGTDGALADRLLAGLAAGQERGGDSRGRQAAAIRVVEKRGTFGPADGVVVDARVDDHPDPIAELARIVGLSLAYRHIAAVAFPPLPPVAREPVAPSGTAGPSAPADPPGAGVGADRRDGRDALERTAVALTALRDGPAHREATVWLAYCRLALGEEEAARGLCAELDDAPALGARNIGPDGGFFAVVRRWVGS